MTLDLAAFEASLPGPVAAALRLGAGPVRAWSVAQSTGERIEVSLRLLGSPLAAELVGWLVGIAMFDDSHRLIAGEIEAGRRLEVIPHVIDALAIGIRAGRSGPKKLWATIEQLVVRSPTIPTSLVSIVPFGCCAEYAPSRDAAIRIAALVGAPAREAIEAARDAAGDRTLAFRRLHAALARTATAGSEPTPIERMLARLVAEWRATRDPELEPMLELAGAEVARLRGPVVDPSDIERAWLALARVNDPGDTTRLLDVPWPNREPSVLAQIEALANRGPDPRVARIGTIARAHESWTPQIRAAIARTLEALGGIEPRPADPEVLAAGRRITGPLAERAALFTLHAANPTDRALRSVLADVLVEAGDPRGEFIALQMAIADGTASDGAAKREAKLLATHADAWTGPLPDVVAESRRFERGFLVALHRRAGGEDRLRASLDRIEWATVEKLHLRYVRPADAGHDLVELVRRMPVLRSLMVNISLDALAVAGPHPTLDTLGTSTDWLPLGGAFPSLEVLGGVWYGGAWYRSGYRADDEAARYQGALAAAAQLGLRCLVSFGFPSRGLRDAITNRHLGPAVARFTNGDHFDASGWRVEIPRDGDRARASFHVGFWDGRVLRSVCGALRGTGIGRLSLDKTGSPEILEYLVGELPETTTRELAVDLDGEPIDLCGP